MTKPKRPTDSNQRAKLIVDIVTGEAARDPEPSKASKIAQKAGLKGGKARAEKLSPEKRKKIAKKAAKSRWNK